MAPFDLTFRTSGDRYGPLRPAPGAFPGECCGRGLRGTGPPRVHLETERPV